MHRNCLCINMIILYEKEGFVDSLLCIHESGLQLLLKAILG